MIAVVEKNELMNEVFAEDTWKRFFNEFPFINKAILFGSLVSEEDSAQSSELEILLFLHDLPKVKRYIHSKGGKAMGEMRGFFDDNISAKVPFDVKLYLMEYDNLCEGPALARGEELVRNYTLAKEDIGDSITLRAMDFLKRIEDNTHFFVTQGPIKAKINNCFPYYWNLDPKGRVQEVADLMVDNKPNYSVRISEINDHTPGLEFSIDCYDEDNNRHVSRLSAAPFSTYKEAEERLLEFARTHKDINFIRRVDVTLEIRPKVYTISKKNN